MRSIRRTRSWLLPVSCWFLAAIFVLGCGPAGSNQPHRGDAAPPVALDPGSDAEALPSTPAVATSFNQSRQVKDSLVIGIDADMSSGSAQAGLAIQRGVILAVDEINAAGGLLGRPVEIVVRDHRGNPDRGVDNIVEFANMPDVLAVVGGLHTPVAVRELQVIHEHNMIYLGPWAAGTPIVDNGFFPNYVFRVSVRDEYAGGFLIDRALERGLENIGLLLERTAWGRSNELAMQNALKERGKAKASVEWFNTGETDMSPQIRRLKKLGTECVMLVCNPIEGKVALQALAELEPSARIPVISHWGITGSDFFEMTKELLPKIDLSFLQTCSFIQPKRAARFDRLYKAYAAKFKDCDSPRDVVSPVGTAHAYEIVMILAKAVKSANAAERPAIQAALERVGKHEGVIRDYDPPFSRKRHDALDVDDFMLARFGENGSIMPIAATLDASRTDKASDE